MKKIVVFFFSIIYLLGIAYLLLPSPSIPTVPNSFQSDEPGDTVQHPDQPAYYTDLSRGQVMNHLQNEFSIKFAGYQIPTYRLNYRPEDSTQYVREQLLTYYLEEIVYPLRESLFVNGWNPRLSPISAPLFDIQYDRWAMIREGKEYQSKVTLRGYHSSSLIRLLVWTSLFPVGYLIFKQSQITLADLAKSIKT